MKTGIAPSVTSKIKPFEMDAKRVYLPGAKVEAKCPMCGAKVVRDFRDQYLPYPVANKAFDVVLWHDGQAGDHHEFSVRITLNVSISLAPKRAKAPS